MGQTLAGSYIGTGPIEFLFVETQHLEIVIGVRRCLGLQLAKLEARLGGLTLSRWRDPHRSAANLKAAATELGVEVTGPLRACSSVTEQTSA